MFISVCPLCMIDRSSLCRQSSKNSFCFCLLHTQQHQCPPGRETVVRAGSVLQLYNIRHTDYSWWWWCFHTLLLFLKTSSVRTYVLILLYHQRKLYTKINVSYIQPPSVQMKYTLLRIRGADYRVLRNNKKVLQLAVCWTNQKNIEMIKNKMPTGLMFWREHHLLSHDSASWKL